MENRYLKPVILADALKDRKMAFISGPRQVGKTSLTLQFLKSKGNYFSWDDTDFKKRWIKNPLATLEPIGPGPVVFDELHKYKFWKTSLKGIYDRVGNEMPILVTGSARLDLYKKGGDSLMGRYIPYRLYPLTVSERISNYPDPDRLEPRKVTYPLQDLLQYSGFPEPLLKGSRAKALRWSRLRLEQLVREDIRDFKGIRDLELMKLLMELLPDRVGSPLSLHSLKEDLQVAYGTVREWMSILKNLYVCFQVSPYSKNIARSLTKESKYYLYDWLSIKNQGALLENVVAVHLLKACHYWTDTATGVFDLHYIRTKDKLEVDFCIVRDKKPWMLVECKSNGAEISPALRKISGKFPDCQVFQLTFQDLDRKIPGTAIHLMSVEKFLSMFI